MPYDFIDFSGLVHDPNSKHCLDIRAKIDGLQREIADRYQEIELNRNNLPQRLGPGEKLRETVRGHRTIINQKDSIRRKWENQYDKDCRPPTPPLPKLCPEKDKIHEKLSKGPKVNAKAAAIGAGIGIGIAGLACAIAEPCGGFVLAGAGLGGLGVVAAQ